MLKGEHGRVSNKWRRAENSGQILRCGQAVADFYKITNINNETFEQIAGDADTLAGLLLEIKGEFPALHEIISYNDYDFEVLEMDERRILKVKFTIHEEATNL